MTTDKKVLKPEDISNIEDDEDIEREEPADEQDEVEEVLEEEEEASPEQEDEALKYSSRVQKRINDLRRETHNERRIREAAEAEKEEAVRFARAVAEENARLLATLKNGEAAFRQTAEQGIEAQLNSARVAYKAAVEDGNTEEMLKQHEEISRLHARMERFKATPPINTQPAEARLRRAMEESPAIRKATAWAAKNPWFNTDPVMNAVAMGVLRKIRMAGGDPDSDEAYAAIETEVKNRFPEYFDRGNGARQRPTRSGSAVTPVNRLRQKTAQRKVPLNETQRALIRQLNITEEQYREHMTQGEE